LLLSRLYLESKRARWYMQKTKPVADDGRCSRSARSLAEHLETAGKAPRGRPRSLAYWVVQSLCREGDLRSSFALWSPSGSPQDLAQITKMA
jgi:hypothetical protein